MDKKIQFIEQMNATECGLTCIVMLANFYGKYIEPVDIRDLVGNSRDGLKLSEMSFLCHLLDMSAKAFKADANSLREVKSPVILHWNENHFVILEKITKHHFYIIDPDFGRKKLSFEQLQEGYSGVFLLVTPNESFQKKAPVSLWKPYINLLLKKPRLLIHMFVLSLVLQAFVLISPMITQMIIDQNQPLLTGHSWGIWVAIIFVLLFCYVGFNIIRNEVSISLFRHLDFELSHQYFSHLLHLPFTYFQNRKTGDLLYRSSSLRTIRNILSSQFMKSVLDIMLVVSILIYVLNKSLSLALVLIALTSALCIIMYLFRFRMNDLNRSELMEDTKLYSFQNEAIQGIQDIKSNALEKPYLEKWKTLYRAFANAYIKRERLLGIVTSTSSSLAFFIPAIILLIGFQLVQKQQLTLGELVAFQSISTYFVSTANSLIVQAETYFQLKTYLKRLQDIFGVSLHLRQDSRVPSPTLQGGISFHDVSFAFTKFGNPVLKNINLHIKAGEKVAIVGQSGSGKSTLINLISGLYPIEHGSIYYDQTDIKEIDPDILQHEIGIVNQRPYLFNQSIAENIIANKKNISREMVIHAAKIAEIHNDITNLPMGYDTILAEQGNNFSGGQIQRIAIARAIVNQPKILIFDEATNALDSITEQKIDANLSPLKITRITVAHRLSSVKNSDTIIIVHAGEIVGQGTHEELLHRNAYYARLHRADQVLEYA